MSHILAALCLRLLAAASARWRTGRAQEQLPPRQRRLVRAPLVLACLLIFGQSLGAFVVCTFTTVTVLTLMRKIAVVWEQAKERRWRSVAAASGWAAVGEEGGATEIAGSAAGCTQSSGASKRCPARCSDAEEWAGRAFPYGCGKHKSWVNGSAAADERAVQRTLRSLLPLLMHLQLHYCIYHSLTASNFHSTFNLPLNSHVQRVRSTARVSAPAG